MKKGFSLIELIVTITIIAVITVATTISFSSSNKRARDSRRMADLQKIALGLEMARQVGSTYPATGSLSLLVTKGYMTTLPADPKPPQTYTYTRITNYTYSLGATMEDVGSTNVAGMGYVVRNP